MKRENIHTQEIFLGKSNMQKTTTHKFIRIYSFKKDNCVFSILEDLLQEKIIPGLYYPTLPAQ